MATKTLRVRLTDVAGSGVTGAQGTVEVVPWNEGKPYVPRLVSSGMPYLPGLAGFNREGIAEVEVLPNDDAAILADDHGFGYRVTVQVSVPDPARGTRVMPKLERVILVTSADQTVVEFGTKVPAVPVVEGADYATQAEAYAAGFSGGASYVAEQVGVSLAGVVDGNVLDGQGRALLPADVAAATYARADTTEAALATKADADKAATVDELFHSFHLTSVPAAQYVLFAAPFALRVGGFSLTTLTAAVPHDPANYWTVRLRRYIGPGNFSTFAEKSTLTGTGTAPITALTPWTFDNVAFSSARDLTKDQMLVVQFLATGAPPALTGVALTTRYQPL